jgi:hypothetical protein
MTIDVHVPASGPSSSLSQAILKLTEVIEEENMVLRDRRIMSHAGFTDRKNHALRELMAARRSGSARESMISCGDLLRQLAASLHMNAELLKLHIGAVGEMSDIIIGSLREADSDGTYSRKRSA